MVKLRCPVCRKETSATLGDKHKVSFKCEGCGTEVLVERHASSHVKEPQHQSRRERYRLHPKRA
jgi:hypothetical protein